jgi:acyl-CoA thioesterase
MKTDSNMESRKKPASEIVDLMYDNDPFSQWLGIERIEDAPGRSVLRMIVRPEMTNGHDIAHGGITFSLADSALAFASNSRGKRAVSIECSINHINRVNAGDVLTAVATESSRSNKLGIYHVVVKNQDGIEVALFKGVVYRTSKEW